VELVNAIVAWLREHNDVLSALAALIAVVVVFFSPIGAVFRAFFRQRRGEDPPAAVPAHAAPQPVPTPAPVEPQSEPSEPVDPEPPVTVQESERPTVAVLPLTNLSDDPDQEYLADGLAEDIITRMSRTPGFDVIARNSTFAYKNQSPDIREIGRNLGARYVVEGSLRKMGDRLRVTIQLIDASTGAHIWAENYDRSVSEFFDLQDDVTEAICVQLHPQINQAEIVRHQDRDTEDLGAWALIREAEQRLVTKRSNRPNLEIVRQMAEKAIEIDPNYGEAYGVLSRSYSTAIVFGETDDPETARVKAEEAISKMREIAPNDPEAFHARGHLAQAVGDRERAVRFFEQSYERNPNNIRVLGLLGLNLARIGRQEDGIEKLMRALELSPQDPGKHMIHFMLAVAYVENDDMEAALYHVQNSIEIFDQFSAARGLCMRLLYLAGRKEEAKEEMRAIRHLSPGATRENFLNNFSEGDAFTDDQVAELVDMMDEIGFE